MATKQKLEPGMGAIPGKVGVTFRVWAPHAQSVSVVGSFNEWKPNQDKLEADLEGYWAGHINAAKVGDEYRFHLVCGEQTFDRIDPYAREVTSSIGNSVVPDNDFDWEDDNFKIAPHNELVIYEMHIGTYHTGKGEGPGTFDDVSRRLGHLKKLGINAIEVMPIAEFAGDYSWGYNPSHIFAVETAYGGPKAFKKFVKKCHEMGMAVILDVVYNHMGPSDLDIWQFDGWSENGKGGIYFYNDERSSTPWGDTRPDYGRKEVRRFLRDNAIMWLRDYRVDGLRYDSTVYMRTVDGALKEIPEAWSLFQEMNGEIRKQFPGKILIAEDLQDVEALTAPIEGGGAGFHSQWCASFVHPIRQTVITPDDQARDMKKLAEAVTQRFNNDMCQRVIYSESHDEVANGHQRVPSEVDSEDPTGWFARKRSTLAAALVFTSPGIPMIFQGQEWLETGWFEDSVPLDWDLSDEFRSTLRMYRDMIKLRTTAAGLCSQDVSITRIDNEKNILAFRRGELLVVANLANARYESFRLGFPRAGKWKALFHSDHKNYGFETTSLPSVTTDETIWDHQPCSAELTLAPYSLMIFELSE